jgi:hypothetical protein
MKNDKIMGIEFLRFNHAGLMELKNGNIENYGVVAIKDNKLTYVTHLGLLLLYKQYTNIVTENENEIINDINKIFKNVKLNNNDNDFKNIKETLIDKGYINIINLEEIKYVIF